MKRISIGSLLLLFSILLAAETQLRPYKLINADTLRVDKIRDEYVTSLLGNVHLFYGNTEFFSDKAEIFEKQKITRLLSNVKVIEDTLTLYTDHVEYQRLQEELHLWGNVFVRELHKDNTIRTFAAQKVFYFRDRREFQAEEEVEVYDERESIRGRCGILRYFLDSEYGYLLMEPVIRLEDKDSLQVAAQKIEYFRSFQKVVANFAVEVATEEFLIQSDFLLYFADEDKAIFLGNPRFLSEFADANAREFQIFFQERQIRQAELHDSCRVDFKAEETQEKESWIVADDMVFDFQDNMLTLCRASGAVDSYYIQDYTPEREYSVNKAQGTHLILSVADNRITRIDMSTEVKGMYKFRKKD